MKAETKKGKRYLKYLFTEPELKDLSGEMARNVRAAGSLKEEKKSITKDFDGKIALVEAEIATAASKIENGSEYRHIECDVAYDYDTCRVLVTRCDTGEIVEDRAMNADEKQLELA